MASAMHIGRADWVGQEGAIRSDLHILLAAGVPVVDH